LIVGGESFARMLAAWERTAASLAETVVRDPRTLEMGARLLRSHLLWKRAFDTAFDAAWTPFRKEERV
jgi:hypothetical protein